MNCFEAFVRGARVAGVALDSINLILASFKSRVRFNAMV
jgi:hypothetical protein